MDSRMRRAALATAIAVLVLPAATLSADRDVPSPGNQYDPAIAFDGTNYFVVWRDDNTVSDIHGARVTQEGAVLDADSIPISHGFSSSPAVAFDGENYLVVWRSTVGSVNSIYGTRVTPNGQLLDPNGIVISTPAATEPAIAFDGTNYLVVWRDNRTGAWRIRGARITPEGTVLDPDSFPISAPTIDQRQSPSVAFGGTHYLVTWDQFSGGPNDIYGARVATDGTVLDQNGIAISTAAFGQESSTIAYDGVNFLVAWSDQRTTAAAPDIFGARVSAAGTVLDPAGIVIAQRPAIQSEPALAFGGENYLAAWYDGIYPLADGDVYGARVSPDGSVLDPSAFAVSVSFNGQRSPAIAFGGENYFVVWEDGRTQEVFDIQGSRVTPDGTVLDPGGIVISRSTTGPPPPPPGPPPPPAPPPPPPIEPPPPPPPPPPPHRPRRLRHLAHRRHHRHRPHPRLHPDHRRLHHLRHHLRPHRRLHRHLPAGAASSPGWSACD